jgi:hypothetical protein
MKGTSWRGAKRRNKPRRNCAPSTIRNAACARLPFPTVTGTETHTSVLSSRFVRYLQSPTPHPARLSHPHNHGMPSQACLPSSRRASRRPWQPFTVFFVAFLLVHSFVNDSIPRHSPDPLSSVKQRPYTHTQCTLRLSILPRASSRLVGSANLFILCVPSRTSPTSA